MTSTELIASQPRATQQQIDTVRKGIKIEDSQYVSQYGQSTIGTEAHQGVLDHLENSPIAALAGFMQQILMATKDTTSSSPMAKRKSLVGRLVEVAFGTGLEEEIVVASSKRVLNANLADAQRHADSIAKFLELAAGMTGKLTTEASEIDSYVEAGRAYLTENPDAGKPQPGQMEFVNHRERFERRLSNLQTLYVSHLMSITQLKLAQAQAIDILDRFKELRDVLLPVYRQQQLANANKQFLNQEVARLAIQAHESIQSTVEKSLRGLPQTQ